MVKIKILQASGEFAYLGPDNFKRELEPFDRKQPNTRPVGVQAFGFNLVASTRVEARGRTKRFFSVKRLFSSSSSSTNKCKCNLEQIIHSKTMNSFAIINNFKSTLHGQHSTGGGSRQAQCNG